MNKQINNIKALCHFGRKPTYTIKGQSYTFIDKTISVFVLVFVGILVNTLLVTPANHGLIDATFKDYEMRSMLNQLGWQLFLFIGVIGFPLCEEFLFRYHIKFLVGSTIFYLLVIVTLIIISFIQFTSIENAAIFIFLTLSFALVTMVFFVPKLRTEYIFKVLFVRYYSYHVWLSAFLFAALHIFNFNLHSTAAIVLSPLLVLPQLLAGILLSYVRLTFGITYAILMHGLNNAILFWFILPV